MKDRLSILRKSSDDVADEAITKYMKSERKPEAIVALFDSLKKNRTPVPAELPESLKDYFRKTEALPDWMDARKVRMAQQTFALYGPQILLLLGCKSLPTAYSVPAGAKVLVLTGRLDKRSGSLNSLNRRIMETTQFVIDLLAPGSLAPEGRGIRTTQKVRLMHAASRYYVKKISSWKKSDGVPINQEFMLGTLMSFSALTIDGLEQIGIPLSDMERDAYLHMWNVIGYLLGLQREDLPDTLEEARALAESILHAEARPSKEGKELTQALIDYFRHMMPGNLFDEAGEVLIRYLVGDERAKILGISSKGDLMSDLLPGLVHLITSEYYEAEKHSHMIRKLTERYSRVLLESMVFTFNHDKGIHFDIPPSLRGYWKPTSDWKNAHVLMGPFAGWRIALQNEF